jgi:hypothetical protein
VLFFLKKNRFDEMVDHMKSVAQQPQELTVEERNLLSVAYKNVIGSRRASWRVISSIEQKGEADKLGLIKSYKKKIESELEDICSDILEIIKNELIPNSDSEEGKVFYYKMKGDYHRCACPAAAYIKIYVFIFDFNTDIWLSFKMETCGKSPQPRRWRLTRPPRPSLTATCHPLTPFASALPSTSPYFTTRS